MCDKVWVAVCCIPQMRVHTTNTCFEYQPPILEEPGLGRHSVAELDKPNASVAIFLLIGLEVSKLEIFTRPKSGGIPFLNLRVLEDVS